jgi:DNA polymerase-3 subunit alpha
VAASNFVHLHLHTDYSLLDGACEIGELTAEAARRGMPAVAVTDHGNLFAAANFFHEATTHGVKPIIGCEVYVAPDSHKSRGTEAERSNHLVLLCETNEGYSNLIKLVSTGFLDGFYYKPRVDHDLLAKHSRGLIALSACLRGEVTEAVVNGKLDRAKESAYRLQDIFGKGNFFLEVQNQGMEIEQGVNRDLIQLSKQTGIPLVATNDCHYLTQSDARAQEVLMCIQTGKTMSEPNRMKFATDQFYFKTAEEMARAFREVPDALTRTLAIAERCKVKIKPVDNPFPEFQVPEGHTAESYFEQVVRKGFVSRVPELERNAQRGLLRHPLPEYERRLSSEIEMIKKMRFAGYFLIVWDFIHYARTQGVPVGPGRGSAAGSLVSYALRITDIDPLQYDLLFERFLNPERVSMPDIDIDFCVRRRGEVIEYVRGKYGEENVAQIITFGTMAAKAAIKDVGRALDMPYGDVDRLAKLIPEQLNITLDEALKRSPQLAQQRKENEQIGDLVSVALRLEGLARHASTHAAGVVISPQKLTEIVPLYKSSKEEVTTQYDMSALERLGLLKMDFLGLTTLTVLCDTVDLIRQNRKVELDLATLGTDDPETYKLFTSGDTTGIFQFESHGMRDILRRYQPTRLEDLTALNALYRPGPIQGGMIDEFIDRKHGKRKVTYDLPELESILSETWGVMVYQEQVMQVANRLAGFSLGEADILRRAMGKKKREEMAAQREKFLVGCQARKINVKKAEKIFDLMAEFAGYGFNKSHACAYALVAYQTAYLKKHYPVEFIAAMLTAETGKSEKVVKYIAEARQLGITVLPPDVHESSLYFTPVGENIRFGLAAVKNVGEGTARAICEARGKQGRFRDLPDFCAAVGSGQVNRRVLESLVKAGAFDSLGGTRAGHWAAIDEALKHSQRLSRERNSGQNVFFGGGGDDFYAENSAPAGEVPEWSEADRLAGEFATLGFYISGHPLDKYMSQMKALGVADIASIEGKRNGAECAFAGAVVQSRMMRTKRGQRWAIVTLQDRTGMLEALLFPETFQKLEPILKNGQPVVLKGRVNVEESGSRLAVADGRSLEQILERLPSQLRVRVNLNETSKETLERLDQLMASRPGRCRVEFDLLRGDGSEAILESQRCVQADPELLEGIRGICGADAIVTS